MPGIGVRTASNIPLGIGGDIANFKSAAHLAAYAGIAPVTGQSGTSIKGRETLQAGQQTPQERAVAVLVRRVHQTPAVHRDNARDFAHFGLGLR